ncbi:MAG TPA: SAM-dependent methyltransferase [Firmicutes bacterium]|jgi:hypothetical protein|nr:SAM-dependent methyltransferase [Bacillota bacterium]
MHKNAIQKYAVWARNELIEQVQQRAYQYDISDKGYGDEKAAVVGGRVLSADEQRQRHEFVLQIKENGFQQAVEEVAYTWFNRFVALRFMEVNDYLPTHVRVFSDASGGFNPEILKDVLHLDLPRLDKVKVSELLNSNQTEELYRYLLLTQCNALNAALPEMFEKLGSYTEMLLPNNILKPESVIGRLVRDIPEDDWRDTVQIIGWMYQYYNTEPKQAVFDGLKRNIKITKEKIPAATQLFTPDWIVRYMVENSLGRLWLESHPNDVLKANWKYYLDEAKQTPEVAEKLRILRSQSPVKSPEDIRLIDPCMGSGHILVYAFDVLMQIYESEGYNPRDAAKLILEKNVYGLDIDRRAYQLAYFSLMMKARQYDRRIFSEDIKPQVYHPAGFSDGEEYGSLVKVDVLPPKPVEKSGQLSIEDTINELQLNAWNFKRLLAQKYDVVVTNPPYMGNSGFNSKLGSFIASEYNQAKNDLYSAMVLAAIRLCKKYGYTSMITMQSWLNAPTFLAFRKTLFKHYRLVLLNNLGSRAFDEISGEKVKNTAFVFSKDFTEDWIPKFIDVTNYTGQDTKEREYLSGYHQYEKVSQSSFLKHPLCLAIYKTSSATLNEWTKLLLRDKCKIKRCIATGNDDEFIRLWYEVHKDLIGSQAMKQKDKRWFFISNGGLFRRWFGNLSCVIDWEDNGNRLRKFNDLTGKSTLRNVDYMFQEGATYTYTSMGSGVFNSRYLPQGVACIGVGPVIVHSSDNMFIMGLTNSKTFQWLIDTMFGKVSTFETGNIGYIPYLDGDATSVNTLVRKNISLSRTDWDAFETSWDFTRHPLICDERSVTSAFAKWECEAAERFDTLKSNEEELNRIFIDIYGLQDELTPEVDDKDVTVRRADLRREIRSLISYAVGCMFGRYSLDTEGLVYAGGDWDAGKYRSFIPDKDNILPICDDEYFNDDIVGRFVDFVCVVYGVETLEENLKFIADALGGKGTPREVIRNYFLNDFYTDHCKIYQKRPIYWLFDSGKKNGFKALIYLHRYSRDLLAKLRTDYVHEQQERYRTQLSHIAAALNTATGSERARLLKQQNKLSEQLKEITAFEEKVHHLADQNIGIDLDDGVKKNYEIFADVLAKI